MPTLWELLGLAAMLLIGVFFGAVAFYRVLGLVGVAWALSQAITRDIPVGIEGLRPSFHLRGVAAVVVSLVLAALFAASVWFAPELSCYLSDGKVCE